MQGRRPARIPNERLRALLTHTGWTQQGLARAINSIAAESGLSVRYDRTAVAHWLTGTHPQDPVPAVIAEAFSRKLHAEITPADLGLHPADPPFTTLDPATDTPVLTTLTRLARADLDPAQHTVLRHEIYRPDVAVPGWAQATRHHVSIPIPCGPLLPGDRAAAHTEAPRHMVGVFALALRRFGGRHARNALLAYLAHDLTTWLRTTTRDAYRPLVAIVADLVTLAGFTAFDDHAHALAQRYYRLALTLALDADDPTRYAITLRLASQQARYLGHYAVALTLAGTALATTGGLAPPGTEAFLHTEAALCHAALGNDDTARHHLDLARHHLARMTTSPPTALGTAHPAELAWCTAAVRAFGHDHPGAITALHTALRHYPTTDRCPRALALAALVQHHLDSGHHHHAHTTWHRFLADYPRVHSARIDDTHTALAQRMGTSRIQRDAPKKYISLQESTLPRREPHVPSTESWANTPQDPREFASRKVPTSLGVPTGDTATVGFWVQAYLTAAVEGVRSPEVAGKIARHLGRFRNWFADGFGHDRITAITAREVTLWRDHLATTAVRTFADGRRQLMAPATVNNYLAHLSALFTWITAHTQAGLLAHGDPTKGMELLPLPAPEPRALTDAQVRTVKNVLDRLDGFHRLTGRRHQGGKTRPATHRHARPSRDKALVHVLFGTGLRRAELVGLDLAQLQPNTPTELRRVKKARLTAVHGKGRTQRTVFLGHDARLALADYLEHERPGDTDEESTALFLAAASIATRRPGGRLSPRTINTIVSEVGRIHDLEVDGAERQLGTLRPHDARHTFAYRLSAASWHNRAELERRLGPANDRYLKLYTNPPEDIAANWAEHL